MVEAVIGADTVEAVRLAVADLTPERAEAVSGLPAEEVRRLARDLAGAGRAAAYGRMGLSTQGFGSLGQWAIHLLNVLTGNLDSAGVRQLLVDQDLASITRRTAGLLFAAGPTAGAPSTGGPVGTET